MGCQLFVNRENIRCGLMAHLEANKPASSAGTNKRQPTVPYRIDLEAQKINEMNDLDYRFSIAPMMDWTD